MTSVLPRLGGCATTALLMLISPVGCVHYQGSHGDADVGSTGVKEVVVAEEATRALKDDLAGLAPTVRQEEAEWAAVCAQTYSRQQVRDYRLIWPPLFHNFLVNLRLKQRGLCYHWAEDLSAYLLIQNLSTLQVRWAISRAGTRREHNAVVLTALDQPFEEGIVLDAWRNSGRLYWSRVGADRYPWLEADLSQ